MSASTPLTASDLAVMNSYEAMVSTDPNWASKLQGIVDPAVFSALQTYSNDANLQKADSYGAGNTSNWVSTGMATPQQLFGADYAQGDKINPAFIDAQMDGKSTAGIPQWLTPAQVAAGNSYILPGVTQNQVGPSNLSAYIGSSSSGIPYTSSAAATSAATPSTTKSKSIKTATTASPASSVSQTTANNEVTQLFQQYLGRAPASAGLTNYATQLMNGTPLSSIQQQISSSPEAKMYANTGIPMTAGEASGFASLTPAQQQAQIQYYDPKNPNQEPGTYNPADYASVTYNNAGGASGKPSSGFDPNGMTFQQLAAAVNSGTLPAPTSGGTPNTALNSAFNSSNLTFDGVPLTVLGYGGGSNPGIGQTLLGSGATNSGWDYNGQPISVSQQKALYDYLTNNQLNRGWAQFLASVAGGVIGGEVAGASTAGSTGSAVGDIGTTTGSTVGGVTGTGSEAVGTGSGTIGGISGGLENGIQTVTVTGTPIVNTGLSTGQLLGAGAAGLAGAGLASSGTGGTTAPSPTPTQSQNTNPAPTPTPTTPSDFGQNGVQTVNVNSTSIPPTSEQLLGPGYTGPYGIPPILSNPGNPQVVTVTGTPLSSPAPTPTPTSSNSGLTGTLIGMGLGAGAAGAIASGTGSPSPTPTPSSSDQNSGLASSLIPGLSNSSLASLLGPLISGAISANAQNNALSVEQGMFNTMQANAAPYINAGKIAAGQISAGTQPGGQYVVPAYTPFSTAKFQEDPGYQFQLQQGQNALTNAASLTGGMNSNNLKGLIGYTQGMANTDYQTALNNYMSQYQQSADTIQQNFGNVESIAQMGANAGQGLASQGVQVGTNLANAITGAGNSEAAAISGAATGYANSQTAAQNQALQQQYLSWLQSQGGSGSGSTGYTIG